MIKNSRFIRNELLLGQDKVEKLKNTTVMVFGVGGVGGYAVEALARLGIGHLIIVDKDKVDISNLNRQVIALESTLGRSKVEVFKERLLDINPEIKVTTLNEFFNESKLEWLDIYKPDYVIDAIDTITPKWFLIKTCIEKKIPFISSTGMANRLNPLQVEITTLAKTNTDPICRILRGLAKKEHINQKLIKVIFSKEEPFKQTMIVNENGVTRKEKMPPSSIILVPASAGLSCAYYVLNEIIKDID
jgi:tRNA A37 threonylcarbamoyladenosine dehydratase